MKKTKQQVIDQIEGFIGNDGMVTFEHGYPYPVITNRKKQYHVTMVNNNCLFGYYANEMGKNKGVGIPFTFINKESLEKVYESLNNYVKWVKETT